jgi:hypothetical protein
VVHPILETRATFDPKPSFYPIGRPLNSDLQRLCHIRKRDKSGPSGRIGAGMAIPPVPFVSNALSTERQISLFRVNTFPRIFSSITVFAVDSAFRSASSHAAGQSEALGCPSPVHRRVWRCQWGGPKLYDAEASLEP